LGETGLLHGTSWLGKTCQKVLLMGCLRIGGAYAGLIDPGRFPREFALAAGEGAQPGNPALAPRMDGPAGPPPGPFQHGHLNAAVAALASGDAEQADRALRRLADSPEGQAFIRMGEDALARGEEAARDAMAR